MSNSSQTSTKPTNISATEVIKRIDESCANFAEKTIIEQTDCESYQKRIKLLAMVAQRHYYGQLHDAHLCDAVHDILKSVYDVDNKTLAVPPWIAKVFQIELEF